MLVAGDVYFRARSPAAPLLVAAPVDNSGVERVLFRSSPTGCRTLCVMLGSGRESNLIDCVCVCVCVLGWGADFREDVQRLRVSLRGDCQCHRVQVRAARRQALFLLGGVGLEQRHEERG